MPAGSQTHLLIPVLDMPFSGAVSASATRKPDENNCRHAATGTLLRLTADMRPSPLTCPVLARAS